MPTHAEVAAQRGETSRRVTVPPINEEFERYLGSALLAPFGGAFLDQVVFDDISAGVEWSGRFKADPFGRALRTGAVEMLVFGGTEDDRRESGEWLRQAHTDVHGEYDGVRFSALRPEAWNWVLMSAIHLYMGAYPAVTGRHLTDARAQDLYAYILGKVRHVMLPTPAGEFPVTYQEFITLYNETLDRRAVGTVTLRRESGRLLDPPSPPMVPRPAWRLVVRAISRFVVAASFGITHHTVRELSEVDWTPARERDYGIVCRTMPLVYRLPRRVTMTPLAYHQYKVRRHAELLRGTRLDSFAPDTARRCPM
ncbi:hypothetical protein GOEFS_058_00270 [Gordonia effusa NBRC 100432]|uniref:ER-bound oxygenase mpaB/mpaB'/Rubber oxygenase catalytic domain-containing protein n=1 Tax=Gordonia effusa NBRC 100432 TaxID=1077974 RepID=H0R0G5_9ACTN|nr:oxygenase MpaB family protein [Gordonia effusa]GAB18566.1 hypothetical protein GOEFS_058_00270 [Gordonia effusa NBRC 100432]